MRSHVLGRTKGLRGGLQQEGNTTMAHIGLRNSFKVLQEEEDLLHDQRVINVEEVVACTHDVMLNCEKLSKEKVISSPSPSVKSGSIRLREVKEWLRNGRCQESSPTTSETQKLQEPSQVSMEEDIRVPVKFV